MTKHLLLGLLASAALTSAALAQNPQPAPPQATQAPVAPPSASQPPPEKIAPRQGTLSDQLSEQKGTLRPPAVDPGINAPLPRQAQGSMPVIPPPGTPGGNQAVVPK
jgi:hypothetical protein